MSDEEVEINSPDFVGLLLDEPTAGEKLSSMRATLAEMAHAVKTLAQRDVSQVRQELQTIDGHLVNFKTFRQRSSRLYTKGLRVNGLHSGAP